MESGKIIVVANQKGGVAKTSTVRNLSYALAEMGKKVLVVDFDPQYNLTTSFGVLPTQTPCNTGTLITNLLLDESLPDTNEFIQKIGSVDLIPSSRSLTVAEANLLMTPDSNDYLAALLNPLRLSYDYIIVDTNPSLGSLTINALTAADEVIIPIDPELFALTGLQALVDTIKKIKRKLNPSIEIGGILFTKCNKRTNLYRRTYGQVTKVQKLIADSLERTGLSPRYTRPDEKKKDIFPPKEKDENRVFAKDLMGNKHYYYRFYNENGIELYTMEKKREFFQTVYIPCDGFMVGIDQRHRLEEVLKWLPTLEHGIRGEIERVFNQSMEAPDRWADLGFANLLGRYEEAKAHNAPIAAERQRQADERRAQQEVREQQLAQERQARYDSAIREAEGDIMAGKEVINREINGKSLIMQLFREHEIPVPLKTQGWIINSLHSIRYEPQNGEWHYRYFKGSRDSTKMFDLLSKLSAAIQTRQQFEEHGASPPDTPVLDCEEEQEMEL